MSPTTAVSSTNFTKELLRWGCSHGCRECTVGGSAHIPVGAEVEIECWERRGLTLNLCGWSLMKSLNPDGEDLISFVSSLLEMTVC